MDSESLVMTSLATPTSSDFSTRTSTPATTSLDDGVDLSELQPQIRILRHYRAASASPPSAKRRIAGMQNGTGRRRRPSGGTGGVRQIVDVDGVTSNVGGVRSLPSTPVAPQKTCTATTNAIVAATATTTTTTTITTSSTTKTFTSATTTTSQAIATTKSSLLVVTQTSNNSRTSYTTLDNSLDVRLPLDRLQRSTSTDAGHQIDARIKKISRFNSNTLVLDIDDAAAEATKKQRWRTRRQAVVGTPLKDEMQTTQEGERRLNRIRRCVACLKSFVAFFFSTIGLTILLVGYTILGGIIFVAVEKGEEDTLRKQLHQDADKLLNLTAERLWNTTETLNVLHPKNWTDEAKLILEDYIQELYDAAENNGWDFQDLGNTKEKWTFGGALLYSITIITTIGYGHITPKTEEGQVVTMLYAIIGIPLTLLTITNLGGFMATAFRWFYKNIICGVCFCAHCCGSTEAKRRKAAISAAAAAVEATKTVSREVARSSSKKSDTAECRNFSAPSTAVVADASTSQDNVSPSSSRKSSVSAEVQWRTGLRRTLHTGDYSSVHVPIYVSLLLMALYIGLGAMLFTLIEQDWEPLIGFYFCFITLSTIGFGDYVPGTSLHTSSQGKMVLCALYLLVGLALLAMCFDLMQEEVRRKFRALGAKIGLFEHQ